MQTASEMREMMNFEVQPCEDGPWIDPIVEYDHSMGRNSVTGGYVYRGSAIPESLE